MKKNYKTFWDYVAGTGGLYQMGPSLYRTYILDRLIELDVHSILEEGCGTGPIYQLINDIEKYKKWNFKYKGTDFASEMIKVAKKNFPKGNFETQDARKPTEKDDSWECVLLIDTLDHLDNYKEVIAEAARIATKYIVISLWRDFVSEGTNLNDRNMMNKEPGEKPWDDTHLQEYSQKSLIDEFMKHNLKIIEINTSSQVNSSGRARSVWILEK